MTSNRTIRFTNQIYALWKLCLSFRKRDWELKDYPVRIRNQKIEQEFKAPRFKQYRYIAYIVNWTLSGFGDSSQQAMSDLNAKFKEAKIKKGRETMPLPRPGTHVPMELASQERVIAHSELANDFTRRVLDLDWAWISDESSLWDFHADETNELLNARVKEVYGVDISDIESGRLVDILDRIAVVQTSDGPG
jgi:hypothetical protein